MGLMFFEVWSITLDSRPLGNDSHLLKTGIWKVHGEVSEMDVGVNLFRILTQLLVTDGYEYYLNLGTF